MLLIFSIEYLYLKKKCKNAMNLNSIKNVHFCKNRNVNDLIRLAFRSFFTKIRKHMRFRRNEIEEY